MRFRQQIAQSPAVFRWPLRFVWMACCCWGGVLTVAEESGPRFVQEIPSEGEGQFIKCDLQHPFCDNRLNVAQFVAQAVDHGCQAVFITPRKLTNNAAALSQFLKEVETARLVFPNVVIMPAFPWIVRGPNFSDRAMILLPPGDDFERRFLRLAEQLPSPTSSAPLSETARFSLGTLCPVDTTTAAWPAILFNERPEGTAVHRWALGDLSPERLWFTEPGLTPPSRSVGQLGLLDRWDESDSYAGGGWDQLLSSGWNAWAASTGIDAYSIDAQMLQVGSFTETWLRVPELTTQHVLQAVKSGAFFGVRGQAARDVELKLTVPGLPRPASPGETIDAPIGTPMRLELSLWVPDRDWQQLPHRLDSVEIIAVTPERSRVVKKDVGLQGRVSITYETEVPEGGILLRAIGYREVKDGPDYGFHTNPIRVIASGQWVRPVVVVNSEPWLSDQSGLVVVGLTLLLAVGVVIGWLGATGKFTVLFGDIFAPWKKRWKSSTANRVLYWLLPGLKRSSRSERETLGSSLSETECERLTTALIVGTASIGAQCGWLSGPLAFSIPYLPAGTWGSALVGGLLGIVWGSLLRGHAFLGIWLFFLLRLVADIWPGVMPEIWVRGCFSAALIGLPVYEAVRTGTLRWPAAAPVTALIGLIAALAAATVFQNAFPGWIGSLAHLAGIIAAGTWSSGNINWGRPPLRGLAIAFVMALWFGLRLTQGCLDDEIGSLPCAIAGLAEAIGVGLLCIACRPERQDAIGLVMSHAACAAVAVLWMTSGPSVSTELLMGAVGLAMLLCLTADVPWLATLSFGIALLVLGQLSLFTPTDHGLWVSAGCACAMAALVARQPLRLIFFVAPFVLVSGYLLCFPEGQSSLTEPLTPQMLETFLRRETTPVVHAVREHPLTTWQSAGQMISLFSLAGLSVLCWSLRQSQRREIFDAFGRAGGGALLLSGILLILGYPLQGAAGFALASLTGLWAARIREADGDELDEMRAAAFSDRVLSSFRRRLAAAACVLAGLIAYGSLVPFQWREISGGVAINEFLAQFRHHIVEGTIFTWHFNSDRIVNLSLTVPFAFCLYGSFVLGRRGIMQRLAAILEAWQLSLVLSFLVELAQQWSNGRVASVHDVVAQGIGAGVGILLWIVIGEWFVLRLAAVAQERTTEGRWGQLLWPYVLGVLVFSVMPAGMPVTSPRQLLDRFRDGHLQGLPFADCHIWRDVLKDAVAGVILFVPMGVWGCLAFRRAGQPLRSIWSGTGNGLAIAAVLTVARGLCSAEMTDTSWLLTGLLGSALGAAALHALANQEADRYASWKTGFGWWVGSLAFGAVIAGYYLHPWSFDAAAQGVSLAWSRLIDTPFAKFHTGNDWLLLEELVRKLTWCAGWGLLLGQAIFRSSESRVLRLCYGVFAVLLAAMTGLAIEIGQLYQTQHSGDITDVIIYVSGVLVGMWVRCVWISTDEARLHKSYGRTSYRGPTKSWVPILQTAIAVGLAIGLLTGLIVLISRR